MGNMTSYGGRDYSWEGRELRQVLEGTSIYAYKYNADGIRTSKTVNGTATEYFLNGTQILAQKTGSDIMWFFYDSRGNRAGLLSNDTVYYYIYDLQGDVIALARASTGEIVAGYSYDAWGNCTVTNAAGYTIGNRNPFRYRGYYYDNETGLYYLNSRYYSPELGRFISADVYISTGQGLQGSNGFAYCLNNPVNRIDTDGHFSFTLAAMIIGGVIGGASQVYANLVTGNPWSDGLAGAVAGGAIYAFLSLAPFGNPVLAAFVPAFGAAFVESAVNEGWSYIKEKRVPNKESILESAKRVAIDTVKNGTIYYATGKVASKIEPLNKHWIKPTKIITCFTGNYARKVANQSFAHALLTLPLKRPVMVPCIH